MEVRICRKCGEEKALTRFNVRLDCIGGRGWTCRACSVDPEKIRASNRKYYYGHRDKQLVRNKIYYNNNKSKRLSASRVYFEVNKDKCAVVKKKYYQNHKAEKAASNKKSRERDPARARIWQQVASARLRSSRAGHAKNLSTLTSKEWSQILDLCNFRCCKCGTNERISLDHIIPVNKGGRTVAANVQPLCSPCNLEKFQQTVDYRPLLLRQRFGG